MTIKKAELHVHLEGTIKPDLAKKLAKRNQISFPEALIAPDGQSYSYPDFMGFLKAFDEVASVIKQPRDYYDITFDYLKENALEGTIYVEMMYSPDHAERASGIPSTEHLQAIQQAIEDAEAKFNIIGRIIIIAVRHFGVEAVTKAAEQAIRETMPYIVGFGLGGDEINYPPKLFHKAFSIAAEGGLFCTVHAGEFASASGMLEAMEYLPIKRIGHGVQAMHSVETLAQLKERGIALEICPSSNIALGLFKDMLEHPLTQLMAAGIPVSLGSDDPPFFRTNLAQEYKRVQQAYHYSDSKMIDFTTMAIKSSFADEATKLRLMRLLN
ncbi:adenosine deaminase [Legionella micdadei]|uniref:Adenosine deaminase n=1 Tax=Legionella micdadei TaxID=451 RepID=A0A098GHQ1_LEGMI|nr:adenosine deaminase [Legionella micdadei]ARG96618.1 adenosine deaminase [Legionella micdadei]KTD29360.1 adenosine deaminase [Legionella micdadei]NSL18906.1 adenosine deaminase [Legionella micdadei]CEG62013.1 Adenosine deaminase [Legionella micdadei]SCY77205.1 adenosine deaminase [Legionella micdadei]